MDRNLQPNGESALQDLFKTQVEAKKGCALRNSDLILPRFNSVKLFWEKFPKIFGPSFVVQANQSGPNAFKGIIREREQTNLISDIGLENCLLCNR